MKSHTSLVYYKRHTPACPLKADKFNFKCDCIIWLMGRTPLGIPVPRTSTKQTERLAAERFGAEYTESTAPATVNSPVHGYTLQEAMKAFRAAQQDHISEKVDESYVTVFNRFITFCASQGIAYMKELTTNTILNFRDQVYGSKNPGTKDHMMSQLLCFLRAAKDRDYITEPLADKVKHKKKPHVPTEPYTDAEIDTILREAELITRKGGFPNAHTFRVLLELMLQTGMRVSDAVLFKPDDATRSEHCWKYKFYPMKQPKSSEKKQATVYLSDELMHEIRTCAGTDKPRPLYPARMRAYRQRASTRDKRLKPASPRDLVHRIMNKCIGVKAGIEDCRPHRLRDTFAVRQLRNGATLDEVSRLLAHSSVTVTQKFYAKWTDERESLMESRFANRLKVSNSRL